MLTLKDVEHIAELSKLALSDEEKEVFVAQLSAVLTFVDRLSEVDTSAVEPMAHVHEVTNVLREDVVMSCDSATRDAIIAGFPASSGDLLKVKSVF